MLPWQAELGIEHLHYQLLQFVVENFPTTREVIALALGVWEAIAIGTIFALRQRAIIGAQYS